MKASLDVKLDAIHGMEGAGPLPDWGRGCVRAEFALGNGRAPANSIGNRADPLRGRALHKLKDIPSKESKNDLLHWNRCFAALGVDLRYR